MRTSGLYIILVTILLSGCSFISTTTDTTAQLAEGITNATASTSDGISGPGDDENVRAKHFVKSQLALLRRDAAAGDGEHLRTLASLMGETDTQAFGHWVKNNYSELFEREFSAVELVDYIATQRG